MTVRHLCSALALLGILALAGCATGGTTPQTTTASPTAPAAASSKLELTFLGSDGNVWEMGWPSGTPKQLTTDAQANQVTYSGLVWSPDGSRLAVLRETGPSTAPTGDDLALFDSTGQSLGKYSLTAQPYNTPFAWSPDSALIAYRTSTSRFDPATGDILGRLTIINAQTGATKQTLLYNDGGGGCGGAGFSPMKLAVDAAHNAYDGLDTFTWSPDQQSILVSNGCGNSGAGLVDLATGNTNAVYPAGASYQPGSSGMLVGNWYGNNTITLGLANANGAEHSTLATETQTQAGYNTILALATWSPDGQTVYYEQDNGIWSVGADGSNKHQIIAGAADDSQQQATALMLPRVSPDGALLLYLQLQGSDASGIGNPNSTVTSQCYVAHIDGSQTTKLPNGATAAVWRPVK